MCCPSIYLFACLFIYLFSASWATVIGQERHPVPINPVRVWSEFKSTYLCFCPGSSHRPRSIWNASRTAPPGTVYFPPTNLLQAAGQFPLPWEFLGAITQENIYLSLPHQSGYLTSPSLRLDYLKFSSQPPKSPRRAQKPLPRRRAVKTSLRWHPGDTCLRICISHCWLDGQVLKNWEWT